MAITPTFSQHLVVTHAALFDELEKIAETSPNREKLKKWLKETALTTAGVGAGTAAALIVDKLIGKHLGNPGSLGRTLPLLGLQAIGTVAGQKLMQAKFKARNE